MSVANPRYPVHYPPQRCCWPHCTETNSWFLHDGKTVPGVPAGAYCLIHWAEVEEALDAENDGEPI